MRQKVSPPPSVGGYKKSAAPVLTLSRLERLHCDVLPAALLPLREGATLRSIEAGVATEFTPLPSPGLSLFAHTEQGWTFPATRRTVQL